MTHTNTETSNGLVERFQRERSEYFSPPICEILGEYEAWRSDRLEHLERALTEITVEYRTHGAVGIDVMFDIANAALNRSGNK